MLVLKGILRSLKKSDRIIDCGDGSIQLAVNRNRFADHVSRLSVLHQNGCLLLGGIDGNNKGIGFAVDKSHFAGCAEEINVSLAVYRSQGERDNRAVGGKAFDGCQSEGVALIIGQSKRYFAANRDRAVFQIIGFGIFKSHTYKGHALEGVDDFAVMDVHRRGNDGKGRRGGPRITARTAAFQQNRGEVGCLGHLIGLRRPIGDGHIIYIIVWSRYGAVEFYSCHTCGTCIVGNHGPTGGILKSQFTFYCRDITRNGSRACPRTVQGIHPAVVGGIGGELAVKVEAVSVIGRIDDHRDSMPLANGEGKQRFTCAFAAAEGKGNLGFVVVLHDIKRTSGYGRSVIRKLQKRTAHCGSIGTFHIVKGKLKGSDARKGTLVGICELVVDFALAGNMNTATAANGIIHLGSRAAPGHF